MKASSAPLRLRLPFIAGTLAVLGVAASAQVSPAAFPASPPNGFSAPAHPFIPTIGGPAANLRPAAAAEWSRALEEGRRAASRAGRGTPGSVGPNGHSLEVSLVSLRLSGTVRDEVAALRMEAGVRSRDGRIERAAFALPLADGTAPDGFRWSNGGRAFPGYGMPRTRATRTYGELLPRPTEVAPQDPMLVEIAGEGEVRVQIAPLDRLAEIHFDLVGLLTASAGARELRVPLVSAGLEAPPPENLSIHLDVETSAPLLGLYSPTHRIEVKRESDRRALVRLAGERSGRADEFRLRILSREDGPRVLVDRSKEGTAFFLARVPVAGILPVGDSEEVSAPAPRILSAAGGASEVVARVDGSGESAALLFLGRCGSPGTAEVRVSMGGKTATFPIEIPRTADGSPVLASLWAAARAADLRRSGGDGGRRVEIERLAVRFGLLVPETAYLGLEEEAVERLARNGFLSSGAVSLTLREDRRAPRAPGALASAWQAGILPPRDDDRSSPGALVAAVR